MSTFEVMITNNIKAGPELVYGVLADYRSGHPRILPKPYFVSLEVEQGGYGAGTVIGVQMKVMGIVQNLRMLVTEPKPGSVLQEEEPSAGIVTTFLVEPDPDRGCCSVSIRTQWQKKGGIRGWIEQLVHPAVARPIYRKELEMLKAYCEEKQQAIGS